jgi:hypothetical protein
VQHPFEGILNPGVGQQAGVEASGDERVTRRTWFRALVSGLAGVAGICGISAGPVEGQTWYQPYPRNPYYQPRSYRRWYYRRSPRNPVTTYALGEEGSGRYTTYALGEEGSGWQQPPPRGGTYTTYALGEEGSGHYTTQALGEEGGIR